ncbi:MAG TPA: hypothetical protein VFL49_08510, partial [Pseudolabrys sp.]|nr:hypothetical protein [Pseudolabrys sp.]
AGALSPVLTSDNVFMAIDIFAKNVIDPETGALGTTGTVGATLCTTCAPPPGETPIPGALPLFTSGMGVLGFLGWRRKRRMARQAA